MNPFDQIGSLRPGKSTFDLSYDKKLTCDMGQLIPVVCDEMVPGDVFRLGNELVIRFQPMVAPLLHEINAFVHYFFVPYRILDDGWEDFTTGGPDGQSVAVLPRWEPTNTAIGSLWDYMGFPIGVDPEGAYPLDFPRRAYNLVFNEYYRDENLQDEVLLSQESILNRAWEKDYFTSALPWQQRGIAPSLPISGTTNAEFTAMTDLFMNTYAGSDHTHALQQAADSGSLNQRRSDSSTITAGSQLLAKVVMPYADMTAHNTVDLSDATTFDVSDLRLAFQIQKWMERNARGGARYTEALRAHFDVSPRDDRLQRPEYVGGSKSAVVISEVLQTSETATSPQGNMAGHGLVADMTDIGSYRALEYGLIIGLMSIMPKPAYQQGIDRQWLRRSRLDFYWPEFANLSEQAIEMAELYAQGTEADNRQIFGYQGRYDEMRIKRNMVCGLMRTDFDYWHLGREFASEPALNSTFITCVPRKDIFAAPTEPGLIVDVGNKIHAIRPLPMQSVPGLIDHN